MYWFYMVVVLLIPAVMLSLGLLWHRWPPVKINWYYGYRTAASMRSPQAWAFAHEYEYYRRFMLAQAAVLLMMTGLVMLLIRGISDDTMGWVSIGMISVQILCMVWPMPVTERALRCHFDDLGVPINNGK